jgi:hypothetical protein
LADVAETWDCVENYSSNYRNSYANRYYDYDNGTITEATTYDVELDYLIDSSTTLKSWLNSDGTLQDITASYVQDIELCWTKASDKLKPFASEYEGFMGNYGNTMEHWYHRAAIILWPRKNHYAVLFNIAPVAIIKELLTKTKQKYPASELKIIIQPFLQAWQQYLRRNSRDISIKDVTTIAIYIKDAAFAKEFLLGFDLGILTANSAEIIIALQSCYGTYFCIDILASWDISEGWYVKELEPQTTLKLINKLHKSEKNLQKIISWLLTYQVNKMRTDDAKSLKTSRADKISRAPNRIKDIICLLNACVLTNNSALAKTVIKHVCTHETLYGTLNLAKLAIKLREQYDSEKLVKFSINNLKSYCITKLTQEYQRGLQDDNDWQIQELSNCDCKDCTTLNKFLNSHSDKSLCWPINQERRAHIHRMIDNLSITVSHNTKRQGSPYALMLEKTVELHRQAKIRFNEVAKLLHKMVKDNISLHD